MGGPFAEEVFENSPVINLHDDKLEVFVGKGKRRAVDGVGYIIVKCLGYDDVGLEGFVTEE